MTLASMDDRLGWKLEALRKVLQLEQEKGHTDEAVVGGMDRFLERWVEDPEVRLYLTHTGISIPSYYSLGREERATWTQAALESLRQKTASHPSPPPRPPAKSAPGDRFKSPGELLKRSRPAPGEKRKAASKLRSEMASKRGSTPPGKERGSRIPPAAPSLDAPLPAVKGGGRDALARLARLGVRTYRDALFFFPYRHNDFSQKATIAELVGGTEQTVHVTVLEAAERSLGRRMRATEATVGDETGRIRAVWFNQPFLARSFRPGVRLALSGRVSLFRGRPVLQSPEYEFLTGAEATHTGRLVPIYPLTEGLSQRTVRRIVRAALDQALPLVPEVLPEAMLRRTGLVGPATALRQFHYPDGTEDRDQARRRLAFDELLFLQLGVLARRWAWQEEQPGLPIHVDHPILEQFLGLLPFTLTGAQERVLGQVLEDVVQPRAMSRLLQGEVGSGKTVVATAALLVAAASGYQGALMAPTEILAEQHFQTISRIFSHATEAAGATEGTEQRTPYRGFGGLLDRPLRVALLVGSQPRGEKSALRRLIQRGDVDIVIGTQALIQQEVVFARLGLVIVDEQHRFGVEQRAALRQKGYHPHLLVMTATPIPRTLALTLYGDLDISIIDELPPGRQEIRTRLLQPEQRGSAYRFIRQQVTEGRQAFIICPLVEESEVLETRAAVTEYERLSQEVFPDLRLGLLHGRMKPQEKEDAMARFRDGTLDILVSTPVVEVGIDVPNATVMLVEGAERFGLAQLHQYRGRVGRGENQSYCALLSDSQVPEVRQRLELLESTGDGFELAEADLRLRGPGEFFGTRQSGALDLKMARLSDVSLLELAREEAIGLMREDPDLAAAGHTGLREAVARFWGEAQEAPGQATEA